MDYKIQAPKTGTNPANDSMQFRQSDRKIGLARIGISVFLLVIVMTLSACSPATSSNNPTSLQPSNSAPQPSALPTRAIAQQPTNTPQQITTPTSASNSSALSTPQQIATPTSIDPCVLVNSQEASTLAGTSFGSGSEGTTPEGLRTCTYGSQATNIFIVDAIQAPSIDAANAAKAQFLADLQADAQQFTNEGLNITQLPNFADGAVLGTVNLDAGGISVNASAIGFLKGTIFVGFSDVVIGGAAPSSDALQSEATTVLGRLP
jgi:hypothetical protein